MFDGIKILYLERSSIFQFQNGKIVYSNKIANSKLDNEKISIIKDVNDKENFCRAVKHYFETDFKDAIMEVGLYSALGSCTYYSSDDITTMLNSIMDEYPCYSMIGAFTIVFDEDATADQIVEVFKIILYSDLFKFITFTRSDNNVLELDDLLDTKLEYIVTKYERRLSNHQLVENKLKSFINLCEDMNDFGLDKKEIEIESFRMIERLEKILVDMELSNFDHLNQFKAEDKIKIRNLLYQPLERSLGKEKISYIDDQWIRATYRNHYEYIMEIIYVLGIIDDANKLQMQRIEAWGSLDDL